MKRHVIYIPGYDPRPSEVAFSFFQKEIARYGDLRNVACTLEATKGLDEGNSHYALWQARSNQPGKMADTDLYFVNWRDLVLREFQLSGPMRILLGFWTFAHMVFSGYYFRLLQRHVYSTLFWAYPPLFFCGSYLGDSLSARAFSGDGELAGLQAICPRYCGPRPVAACCLSWVVALRAAHLLLVLNKRLHLDPALFFGQGHRAAHAYKKCQSTHIAGSRKCSATG